MSNILKSLWTTTGGKVYKICTVLGAKGSEDDVYRFSKGRMRIECVKYSCYQKIFIDDVLVFDHIKKTFGWIDVPKPCKIKINQALDKLMEEVSLKLKDKEEKGEQELSEHAQEVLRVCTSPLDLLGENNEPV